MTKRLLMMVGVLAVGAASALAQAPAGAPAGTNGICKDGTYSNAASKSGACRGHKGVQTWYTASASTPAAPAAKAAAMPAPSPSTKPAPAMAAPAAAAPMAAAPAAKPTSAKQGPAAAAAAKTAAPGGGPGLVWVNTSSKVYHCYGDTYYGKTKAGSYMTEDAAKQNGAHGVGGKSCPAKSTKAP